MKIFPVRLQKDNLNKINSKHSTNQNLNSVEYSGVSYPKNYYLLNFEGRVQKDLESFIKRNENNLPYTLKAYVENLPADKRAIMSPIAAQRNAFEYLSICDSVEDVKEAYPKEPLFSNLKSLNDSKATRGILYDIRLMKQDLSDAGEGILSTEDEDLTVYILKKIFLEGKTLAEINEDIDKDINPLFKREDKTYVLFSTLDGLGIQFPQVPYLNSLRFTREGYSDKFGEKVSKRWKDLSQEEKDKIKASHTSSLSQEQKDRMSEFSKERWNKMSESQRLEIIEAMQQGSQKKQIIMTDVWNNSPDIRSALADYFVKNNFYSPQSVIYRTNVYSPAMKIIMENFWHDNPQFSKELGNRIVLSYERYDAAEAKGKEEEFEKAVLAKKDEIKSEMKKAFKVSKKDADKISGVEKYKTMFSFLPQSLVDWQSEILSNYSDSEIDIWIRYCMGQKLDKNATKIAESITEHVAPRSSVRMQYLICAAVSMFEGCLAPIVNPETGEKFSPIFPTNINFRFPEITRLYFNIKKHGYENVEVLDSKTLSTGSILDAKDFATEDMSRKIMVDRNPNIKFNTQLMKKYKYRLAKEPDFEALERLYDMQKSIRFSDDEIRMFASMFHPCDSEDMHNKLAQYLTVSPEATYAVHSNVYSDGMKFRILKWMKSIFKENNTSLEGSAYLKLLEEYEKRFIDFFAIKS